MFACNLGVKMTYDKMTKLNITILVYFESIQKVSGVPKVGT